MSRLSADPFFSQQNCSTCPNPLPDEIKAALRAKGYDPASFEGCGYTPDVERMAF
jgi:hypothetical protein